MGGEGSEQHILELFIHCLRPGDVVYDIGSSIGLYTVILAKGVGEQGQVVAFEPERQCYDHLQHNLRLNRLTNVWSFRKALGDYTGEAGFDLANYRLAHPYPGRESGEQEAMVEVVQGDQFVEAEQLSPPRAVKIDVEGYEYAVIKGLSQTLQRPSCELVCCEIHPKLSPSGIKPEMVLDLLKSLGFNRIDIYPRWDTYHAVCHRD